MELRKINKNWWWVLIIGVAVFWRFWEYGNRWVLNQDQARDAIIGLYGLRNGTWPVIGSPSSAGPFNFGPWYHWIIMVWEKFIPTVDGPWIGFGILSVISVIICAKIGEIIDGKKGLIIFGLITAFSVGQVENSPDMLNTVIVGVAGMLAMWTGLKLIITNKIGWAILTGLAVGLSINFHFQALGTLSWLLALVVVNNFSLLKRLVWGTGMLIGLLIAFTPIIIFDIQRNGVWIRSVIEYYTVGVNRFYAPVRWLIEIRDFWPQLFGSVTVGVNWFGYVIVILIAILVFIKNKNISRYWLVVGVSLLIQVLLMRNYKGVRSREYMIGFHSFIILITSWMTVEYYKLNKYFGLLIFGTIFVMAGVNNWQNIKAHQSQAREILEVKKILDETIRGPVEIFQYQQSDMASLPIFYLYYYENRIGEGEIISICDGNRYVCPTGEIVNKRGYKIYDDQQNWDKLTPENIYDRLMVNYGKVSHSN